MRDILDALENVQTNVKKPMDMKKEMNKKPAVMKALSLESEGVEENKTPGDSHYNKEKAKELAKKDGKDPEKLSHGELMDYISKAEKMNESLENMLVDIQDGMGKEEFAKKYPLYVNKYEELRKEAMQDDPHNNESISEEVPRQYTLPISKHLVKLDNMQDAMRRQVLMIPEMDDGDLTDQVTTMLKLLDKFDEVMMRSFAIIPESKETDSEAPNTQDTENNMETTTTKVDEGGMKQAEIEVQDWVAKYENHTGVNGDELPKGYLQAMLNSGIMSDAYDQDEYMAFNKMNGYEDDGDWQEGDMEKFMASSPITGGMFNAIDMIKTKYGIDDEMVNSIMGYFDEGKTNQKDTVEVAVEDLARVLELAGLGKEVIKADEQAQAEATSEVELDEYSNSPDEDYFDTDTQLNKMSGGLNGPKKQYKKEYPGDNPLAVDLEQKLAKMLSDM